MNVIPHCFKQALVGRHKVYQRYILIYIFEDVPLMEFMYLVFTRVPYELPYAVQVFVVVLVLNISSAIINSIVC